MQYSISDLPLVSFCLSINRPYRVPLQDIQANLDPLTHYHIPTVLYSTLRRTRFIGVDFLSQTTIKPYWWCAIHEENHFVRIPDTYNRAITKALDKIDGTLEGFSRGMVIHHPPQYSCSLSDLSLVISTLPRSVLAMIPQDQNGPILYRGVSVRHLPCATIDH